MTEKDARMRCLCQQNKLLKLKIKSLTAKLDTLLESHGVVLDDATSKDFHQNLLMTIDKFLINLNLIPFRAYSGSNKNVVFHEVEKECTGIL